MDKLSRHLLPFYMKLPVFWAFIVLSVLGQLLWVAAISQDVRIDLRWSSFGYGLGIGLGFMHGKWTSRLWQQSYLKVLKAADNLLGSERRETPHLLHLCCTRITDFLSFPHPLTRYVSRHPILRFRLHRRDERGTAVMGAAYPEVN